MAPGIWLRVTATVTVCPGTSRISRVGKIGAQFDGAGGGADHIADEIDRRLFAAAGRARHRHHRHQPVLVELVLDLRQPVLRQHERNLDGLDLGDGDQRLGGGADGGDHIAGLDEDGAGLAVDRRHDARDNSD